MKVGRLRREAIRFLRARELRVCLALGGSAGVRGGVEMCEEVGYQVRG